MIQFSPESNEYVICADENKGPGQHSSYLVTDKGKLKFPENTLTGTGKFLNILNIIYTSNGKIFYTGITELDKI